MRYLSKDEYKRLLKAIDEYERFEFNKGSYKNQKTKIYPAR